MDITEAIRRVEQAFINATAEEREGMEKRYGQVWNTQELQEDFDVLGFLAPYVAVRRKSDGAKGSMEFAHYPRYYFDFQEDKC